MTNASESEPTPKQCGEIDDIVERFREELIAGRRPKIEEYLAELPDLPEPLQIALLDMELRFLRDIGEQPPIEEYFDRFPEQHDFILADSHSNGSMTLEIPQTPGVDSHAADRPEDEVDEEVSEGKNHWNPPANSCGAAVQSPAKDLPPTINGPKIVLSVDEERQPDRIAHFEVQKLLGKGGFGCVYQAYDTQLSRRVAIKTPSTENWNKLKQKEGASQIIDTFREEARKAAGLRHPGIVDIHELRIENDCPYIVQELIEGVNLALWSSEHPLTFREAAKLVKSVAEALSYAHEQGVFHRDLKPANILVDRLGHPHVTDFGLALHESVRLEHVGEVAGTLPYMSPEQLRGDAYKLDGRTDLWALGVVFYELLVDCRPFSGTVAEIREQILVGRPLPPRQRNPSVPEDVNQICCKLLEPDLNDRYSSASALIDDLNTWLDAESTSQPDASVQPEHDKLDQGSEPRVLPKGLRSFDQNDADFFLKLLPGPHDQHGLPESIRFWKSRIEECQPDRTFQIGLLCGPSGCGKSSLIKAGVLPRLDPHVVPIYLDCDAAATESRLVAAIHAHFPTLSGDGSLAETLQRLAERHTLGEGEKLLIVLDQFEQWVHAHDRIESPSLLKALEHCDGQHLQCLLLIREDFSVAINKLFEPFETRFVLGQNLKYVELFDRSHARDVLFEFGRAYGCLPDGEGDLSKDQHRFLDQAVQSLAQDGKVISVRLALFADMIKEMPWGTATLRRVGGPEGLGVAFLESIFSSRTAPASYRYHRRAARFVLNALLPGAGFDIRGQMKCAKALLKTSGYAREPRKFDELIHILEAEVRLITATDAEMSESPPRTDTPGERNRCYQLTHDYLVPALRRWLIIRQSPWMRLRKWCRHPARVPQAAGMSVFLATIFLFFHFTVLVVGHVGDHKAVPTAIVTWIVLFDVPYILLSVYLLVGRHAALPWLILLDILCLASAAIFLYDPDIYLGLFDPDANREDIRERYFIIMFVLSYCSIIHVLALNAIRAMTSSQRARFR